MKSLAFVSKPVLIQLMSVFLALKGVCWHSVTSIFRNSTKDICTISAKHFEESTGAGSPLHSPVKVGEGLIYLVVYLVYDARICQIPIRFYIWSHFLQNVSAMNESVA